MASEIANPFNKIVVYDTETTGLKQPHIISLAYILYENGKRTQARYIICNPEWPIDPGASEVNGFTEDNTKDKPTFGEIWSEIKYAFSDSIYLGHNSSHYDIKVMRQAWRDYRIEEPHHYMLDTLDLAKKMLVKGENVPNYKLGTLCEYFDIHFKDYHQAHVDTMACMKVYNKLVQMNKNTQGAYDYLFRPIEYLPEN